MQKKRRHVKLSVIKGGKGRLAGKIKQASLVLLAVLVAAAVLYSLWYLAGQRLVASLLTETVVAREGVLEKGITTEGVWVRKEQVVAAPATGRLHWLAADGSRLSLGTPVAEIRTPGGEIHTVTAPQPGILSRQLDGLEGALQPGSLASVNVAALLENDPQASIYAEGVQLLAGTLFFKIVENFSWYYVSCLPLAEAEKLAAEAKAKLRFETAAKPVSAVLSETFSNGDNLTLAFTVQEEVPGCFADRFTAAKIVTGEVAGIVLPAAALVLNGEEAGVYILEESLVRFRPVEVLGAEGDQVVVDGIKTGTPVIINPVLVKEGQRLWSSWRKELPVLKEISLRLPRGERGRQ
ncbi:MAG: hypothetical protein GX200_08970 [Firmicutes bacterium]|nr:hypothetical protein [Bacillota bacterium]